MWLLLLVVIIATCDAFRALSLSNHRVLTRLQAATETKLFVLGLDGPKRTYLYVSTDACKGMYGDVLFLKKKGLIDILLLFVMACGLGVYVCLIIVVLFGNKNRSPNRRG
jgi:hypothetical protein